MKTKRELIKDVGTLERFGRLFEPPVSKQAVSSWPEQLPLIRRVQLAKTGRWPIDEICPELRDIPGIYVKGDQKKPSFEESIGWTWGAGELPRC